MKIQYLEKAEKELENLDKQIQSQIKKYLGEISKLQNPRLRGKRLSGNLRGYWRYRVGDYRLICKIVDDKLIIIVITIGHRKEIYNSPIEPAN